MNQFDLNKYPTLNAMAQSDAFIKFVVGPAGCVDEQTEVLTPDGWVRISEIPGRIMIYDTCSETAYFEDVSIDQFPADKMYRFHNKSFVDMVVSSEHKVWYQTYNDQRKGKGIWRFKKAKDFVESRLNGTSNHARVLTTIPYKTDSYNKLSDDEIRLMVAISADGTIENRGQSRCRIELRNERKKERLESLLYKCNIQFKRYESGRAGYSLYIFEPPLLTKDLTVFYGCSVEQLKVISEEALHWGGRLDPDNTYYVTTNKRNADFVQFAFLATGQFSTYRRCEPRKEHHSPYYIVSRPVRNKMGWVNLRNINIEDFYPDNGLMYCPTTSTGLFYARRNGRVFVTGNSAKTSYCVLELFRKACMQAAAEDKVRYTRTLVGRNTYQVLKSATIPTFENMLSFLGESVTFKKGSFPPTAHIRGRLSDNTFVHWDIEFVSFDSEDAVSKLLGYEPTNAFLDEISELPEELIDSVVRRLGRYPSGRRGTPSCVELLGATNGPRKDHWLYRWFLGERDKEFAKIEKQTGRKQFELFRQPPALIERADGDWVPNPEAENIENLPNGYGYYYNMLSGDRERVRSYVEGDFADIVTGKVVYPEFRRDFHVWVNGHKKLPHSMRLYLGFDFGRTPVCVIATATSSGKLIVIDEVMGEDISIDTLCTDYLLPVLRQKYPRSTIEGAWGDPAGNVETQAIDISPFDVLLKHGVPIEDPGGNNKLHPRLEAVKQRLTHLDEEGRPSILITDNCKYIIDSIGSTYIYENVRGRNDTVRDVPTKSHEGWCSDLADALSYLCMGYNALVGVRRTQRRELAPLRRSTV